jgi:hypothetical protein
MNKHPFFKRLLATLALVGMVLIVYLLWARPNQLRWGATKDEVTRPMPGDELDLTPTFLATRAITINGTPQEIWPWLLQMGYGRAGFYGYDILENLGSPRGIHSANSILLEFQHFKVSDKVPISPFAEDVFYAIQPIQYLIWAGQMKQNPGGFIWALYPLDKNHTRLVNRILWSHHWTRPGLLALELLTEFSDYLAIRKILQGVKDRVEGRIEPFYKSTVEFAIYLAALLVFIAALIIILARPFSRQRWLAGLGAGIGWLITWYTPMPLWGAALAEILVLIGLFRAFHRTSRRKMT